MSSIYNLLLQFAGLFAPSKEREEAIRQRRISYLMTEANKRFNIVFSASDTHITYDDIVVSINETDPLHKLHELRNQYVISKMAEYNDSICK